MRTVSAFTQGAWRSGDYTGPQRAMARVTIQRLSMLLVQHGHQHYSSAVFGQLSQPHELPNLKSVHWERSIDSDAATLTLTLYNTAVVAADELSPSPAELGRPGYFSPNRGIDDFTINRWNYEINGWQNRILPDRIIRTYEGYGFTRDVPPELDPHMYPSGVWRIDDVDFSSTQGLITVTCRDLAGILIDEVMFPPVVPFKYYPLTFNHKEIKNKPEVTVSSETDWVHPTWDTDSGVGGGYISRTGTIYGHHGSDAFDDSDSSYWLSIGNARPNAGYSFEYVQGQMDGPLSAVKFKVWGGPYRCYISVHSDGEWQGNSTVPYDPNNPASAPNGSDIRFVTSLQVDHEDLVEYAFKKPYSHASKVRLTFTKLTDSGLGPYPYRAGVRNFKVLSTATTATTNTDTGFHHDRNFVNDYTDIVKRLCAYGAFFWPRSNQLAITTLSDGSVVHNPAPSDDDAIGTGRVWGDFMETGTHPITELGVDVWDKKPLMDGINYVKDVVGFNFFIDETGGAVWRLPNLFAKGNYVGDGGPHTGRWTPGTHPADSDHPWHLTIDEKFQLQDLNAVLSGRNMREYVFIANSNGRFGSLVKGHLPVHSRLRRVAGWTDQHFDRQQDTLVMGDLIAMQQLFTYRSGPLTIPGNPAIQIDDQVKVYERVTGEGYLNYVRGIVSDWDVESGVWTYQIDRHWLGDEPFGNWVFDPNNLSDDTKYYLKILGVVDDSGNNDGKVVPGTGREQFT